VACSRDNFDSLTDFSGAETTDLRVRDEDGFEKALATAGLFREVCPPSYRSVSMYGVETEKFLN
jgi:hypothetical protein